MNTHPTHKRGTRARVLLSSVFGPYARNDEYGSRDINPMELYHNQVTRIQGVFSLRMFHRSFGLMMIKENLDAPCTLLDFPDLDAFIREIRTGEYDVVGISSIIPNAGKVKKMCELVRQYLPGAAIVVGGHVTNLGGIEDLIDADHIVRGDGIRWFQRFLCQDDKAPVKHPMVYSAHGARILGQVLRDKPGDTAAILIPSVGCPIGCNFCSTSALFGGKGSFVNFYETGDELFEVMLRIEEKLKVWSFFILDENFLIHRKRALRLLELMQKHGKSWALNVFSSARVLRSYTMEQLVGLGIIWAWMGLEGDKSKYRKLNGVDTRKLVSELQSHGIRVLGSSIIGLENHTSENLEEIVEFSASHGTDFHQFMLYTPLPGTPLYREQRAAGTLLEPSEFSLADTHGQYRFNFRHGHIKKGEEERLILEAFRRDFDRNGPSLLRLIRTMFKGWQRYKNDPDKRIRVRYEIDTRPLRTSYAGALWAMRKWYLDDERLWAEINGLLKEISREFGWKTRLLAPVIGRYLFVSMKLEDKRLQKGWTMEPATFVENNFETPRYATGEKESLGRESGARTLVLDISN